MPKIIGKHLQFYMDCMNNDMKIPGDGLCLNTHDCNGPLSQTLLDIISPSCEELRKLHKEGYSNAYWGSGLGLHHPLTYNGFTELRQTIVLFMAAMAGEL